MAVRPSSLTPEPKLSPAAASEAVSFSSEVVLTPVEEPRLAVVELLDLVLELGRDAAGVARHQPPSTASRSVRQRWKKYRA